MAENQPRIPKNSSSELGKSGTIIFGGIITREDYNINLVGVLGNQKFEIMRRSDSTIRSALQVVKLPLQSVNWDIEAVTDDDGTVSPDDQEKRDFIHNELFNRSIDFNKFLKQALTQFDFGFSVFEKVFELTTFNGQPRVGIKKLASRKQVTIYKWEITGGLPGVTQMVSDGTMAEIPRDKLIVFTHDQEGDNYVGTSLLRYVYKEWDIKDKLMIVNAIALERLAMGIPVATARDGETPTAADQEEAEDTLSNMRANQSSYLKIPSTMQVEMLDMKAGTTKDVEPFISYLDSRIMTAILARFLEVGGKSGSGSQSLVKDLSSLFMKSEEAVANDIVSTIFNDLIKQLCDMNYADMSSGYPKLTFGTIADDDNEMLSTAMAALVTAGAITPDPALENNLRDRFHIPMISDEDIEKYRKVVAPEVADGTAPAATSKSTPATKKETDSLDEEGVAASLRAAKNIRTNLLGSLAGS
jgi:phage gp29-like protein